MATDQEIRDAGFKYIPQQKYLQNPFQIPVAPVPPPTSGGGGIPYTNAGNDFNPQGNAFGEGTAVSPTGNTYFDVVRREGPKSFAAYNKLSQAGGTAPAGSAVAAEAAAELRCSSVLQEAQGGFFPHLYSRLPVTG